MGGTSAPIDHAKAWQSILAGLREAQGQCALVLCDFDRLLDDLRDVSNSDPSASAASEPAVVRGSAHDRPPLGRFRTPEA